LISVRGTIPLGGHVAGSSGHQRLALTRHTRLALRQRHFEPILAGGVGELGLILREREVTGFAQDDNGVDVELSGRTSLRADYLVGCDGGRSVI
jgi:3-(3-hydroxy-phenyl)propionate hydroxylase